MDGPPVAEELDPPKWTVPGGGVAGGGGCGGVSGREGDSTVTPPVGEVLEGEFGGVGKENVTCLRGGGSGGGTSESEDSSMGRVAGPPKRSM